MYVINMLYYMCRGFGLMLILVVMWSTDKRGVSMTFIDQSTTCVWYVIY